MSKKRPTCHTKKTHERTKSTHERTKKKRRDVPTVGIEPASSRITVKSLSRPPHQSSHLILRARLALECRIYDDRGSCFAKKWVLARRIAGWCHCPPVRMVPLPTRPPIVRTRALKQPPPHPQTDFMTEVASSGSKRGSTYGHGAHTRIRASNH